MAEAPGTDINLTRQLCGLAAWRRGLDHCAYVEIPSLMFILLLLILVC